MIDREAITKHDIWCYTTSNASSRKKVKRGKSKAHRAKVKLKILKGELF